MGSLEHQVSIQQNAGKNALSIHIHVGRHCCLWCLITSDRLKNPPSSVQQRSTAGIIADYNRFLASGGDRKKAKDFNNCVHEPFFRAIPLIQVGIKLMTTFIQVDNDSICTCRYVHQDYISHLASSTASFP